MHLVNIPYSEILLISALIFVVAALYSSIGHGGASGYLAVMAFFQLAPAEMKTTALILNILVAGIASIEYYRAGHFSFKLTWPFIVASIPAAFLGGMLHISNKVYGILLGIALVVAALRLAMAALPRQTPDDQRDVPLPMALPTGAGVGLLSGLVGIGGGIFLSPIIILMKWADTKRTSATAAVFIVVNSLAGLSGHLASGKDMVGVAALPLLATALFGGMIGAHWGANRFSSIALRRILAVVLITASVKMLFTAFS